MNKFLLILIVTFSMSAFGQSNLFDSLKIDSTTKIVGRYPHYDKSKTFEKYNFIIEDSLEIAKFARSIKLGTEVPNFTESPDFKIDIVKNNEELTGWTINPTHMSAMTHDGHTYKFDLNQITSLNEKFPFEYYFEKVIFTAREEYQAYLTQQKLNVNFLFDYGPQFRHEGSFEIEFEKSEKFSSPLAISEFLYEHIDKIVDRNDYSVSYILNERNMLNHDKSYVMTIRGPKKIHEGLKIKKHKNEDWQPTIEDGIFFYKK